MGDFFYICTDLLVVFKIQGFHAVAPGVFQAVIHVVYRDNAPRAFQVHHLMVISPMGPQPSTTTVSPAFTFAISVPQ